MRMLGNILLINYKWSQT